MQDGVKLIITSLVIITLFSFLIIGAVIRLGDEHTTVNTDDLPTEQLDYIKMNETLESFEDTAQTWREVFETDYLWVAGLLIIKGLFGVAKSMFAFIISPFTILGNIGSGILHIPAIVIEVVLGLIIVSGILAIWSLVKKGD